VLTTFVREAGFLFTVHMRKQAMALNKEGLGGVVSRLSSIRLRQLLALLENLCNEMAPAGCRMNKQKTNNVEKNVRIPICEGGVKKHRLLLFGSLY
jgi:hypothetical protein